ncbi:MAG: alpha-mannosidase [Acaryochloridaceae cyanobacterium SU_2_1]|nr:alpha-mannosidase [Acaryochloridaceae cyanobacterium SU_2_1]
MSSSMTAFPLGSLYPSIDITIQKLRQLTQLDIQSKWLIGPNLEAMAAPSHPQTWQQQGSAVYLNDKQHIDWPGGQELLWLGQSLLVPDSLANYLLEGLTLRLALTWWAESAEVFVNGQLLQVGDLFDCSVRLQLSAAVQPSETINLALRLVSPSHDRGALVRSQLLYEPADPKAIGPSQIADELTVLQGYLARFTPEDLEALNSAVHQIDWSVVEQPKLFNQSLNQLRQQLAPWGERLRQRQIHWLGHAHLDLAWLWPVSETWEVAQRTFESVLSLQADFPELIFCHSSPALFAWLEVHRPSLFAQIQARVAQGTWEIAAGLWVEPELNVISGESLVRQVLYGQRYTQAKFGQISATAWLPDSFGFCWQLPQILKQGGVEYFLTQKLRWNDTTIFPHEVFRWRSPDGTEIVSVMLPPIGEQIDAVKMAAYAQDWEAATGLATCLWLPGVGDHGGGPTRDMLELARRWQDSPLFPQLQPTTAVAFCRQVESQLSQLPVWNDELYLELHRGCYTSHADQKRANRRCEGLLYEAELWSAIATLTLAQPYPQESLEAAWKKVLFNQFHDILPGSSIPQVFVDANQSWLAAEQLGSQCLNQALGAIATAIHRPPPPQPDSYPIVVFNALNWQRSDLVQVSLPQTHSHWQVTTLTGEVLPSQLLVDQDPPALLFAAPDIPSVGYCLYWLTPLAFPKAIKTSPPPDWILENDWLRVEVNPQTGELSQIVDKVARRELLAGPGNHLQFFTDQGQYWDAWNIDPDYESHALPDAELVSIEWLSWGPLQYRLRVIQVMAESQFTQEYVLDRDAPYLKINVTVDWQADQVLVKTAFPLTLSAEFASYEIPCGAIQRPTLPHPHPLTPSQTAKWEVPALHWADLSQAEDPSAPTYGVSLLNDCKYGYDAQPNQLRLTLLRSPRWPDPDCDRTLHQFTYALYPHQGSWQTAHTVHRGYELNRPLQTWILPPDTPNQGTLPSQCQCLDLGAENLILMALKQAEDAPHQWVLRAYECHGEAATLTLKSDLNLQVDQSLNLLEQPMPEEVGAWKIISKSLKTQK